MDSPFSLSTYEIANADEQMIWCQRWTPKKQPRGVIFLAHGFAEHCQYYVPLAEALVAQEMVVFTHDHVGHGRSEGVRVHVTSVDVYVRDVYQHAELLRETFPTTPFFIVGHSMGGAISYKCATKRPDYFQGVVLIGPALAADPDIITPFKLALARLVGRVFPKFPVSSMVYELITRDKENLKRIQEDPLRFHGYAKAGWALAMLDAMEEMQKSFKDTRWPFLLLHGESDKICALQGSQQLLQQAISKDKTLKVYPKAYHSLLLEPEGVAEETLKDVVNWIVERAK